MAGAATARPGWGSRGEDRAGERPHQCNAQASRSSGSRGGRMGHDAGRILDGRNSGMSSREPPSRVAHRPCASRSRRPGHSVTPSITIPS